ncbi:hypothetical protein DFJ73DRAFT_777854 [Zopfochytrium polystomum]|nr:hypothetical protein DFJ73DRAFT_777854 [Zopfochytrium polystomum]
MVARTTAAAPSSAGNDRGGVIRNSTTSLAVPSPTAADLGVGAAAISGDNSSSSSNSNDNNDNYNNNDDNNNNNSRCNDCASHCNGVGRGGSNGGNGHHSSSSNSSNTAIASAASRLPLEIWAVIVGVAAGRSLRDLFRLSLISPALHALCWMGDAVSLKANALRALLSSLDLARRRPADSNHPWTPGKDSLEAPSPFVEPFRLRDRELATVAAWSDALPNFLGVFEQLVTSVAPEDDAISWASRSQLNFSISDGSPESDLHSRPALPTINPIDHPRAIPHF